MDEAIRNSVITTRHDSLAAAELAGEVFTRRVITVVLAAITALTFAFGFGNVWGWAAPRASLRSWPRWSVRRSTCPWLAC